MSPQRRSKSGWKPPRDRHEVIVAVLAALSVIVVTFALVWFLRPNRDSGSSSSDTTTPATTAPVTTTTPGTAAPATTVPVTTAPAAPSTP